MIHPLLCNVRLNFYPRSPCGERRPRSINSMILTHFYPRSPCGERPTDMSKRLIKFGFLSTLSLRRATDTGNNIGGNDYISIHALLAESDNSSVNTADQEARFLSTLSLRRATAQCKKDKYIILISIHALLAESDPLTCRTKSIATISIHALLAESDTIPGGGHISKTRRFLSTLSLRRATNTRGSEKVKLNNFYPRSPCGERQSPAGRINGRINFYPRSPCGERRTMTITICIASKFLSTLSLRRATARRASRQQPAGISIHALLAESDSFSV